MFLLKLWIIACNKCDTLKLKDVLLFTAIDTGTSGLLDPELRKLPLVTNKVAVSSMPSQKKIRLLNLYN